jgi:hypothetical protein
VTTAPTYAELSAAYGKLVAEKERYRLALEKIRWMEGINPLAYKTALDALKSGTR